MIISIEGRVTSNHFKQDGSDTPKVCFCIIPVIKETSEIGNQENLRHAEIPTYGVVVFLVPYIKESHREFLPKKLFEDDVQIQNLQFLTETGQMES